MFPKNAALKEQWENAIRRNNIVATVNYRLCRNHFEDTDYVADPAYTVSFFVFHIRTFTIKSKLHKKYS